jgi:hypothetical protein
VQESRFEAVKAYVMATWPNATDWPRTTWDVWRELQWSHPLVALYVAEMGWERLRLAPTPQDARSYGPWMNEARRVYDDCRRRLAGRVLDERLLMVPPSAAQIARGDAAASLRAADESPPALEAPESTEQGRRLREQYGLPPGRPEE